MCGPTSRTRSVGRSRQGSSAPRRSRARASGAPRPPAALPRSRTTTRPPPVPRATSVAHWRPSAMWRRAEAGRSAASRSVAWWPTIFFGFVTEQPRGSGTPHHDRPGRGQATERSPLARASAPSSGCDVLAVHGFLPASSPRRSPEERPEETGRRIAGVVSSLRGAVLPLKPGHRPYAGFVQQGRVVSGAALLVRRVRRRLVVWVFVSHADHVRAAGVSSAGGGGRARERCAGEASRAGTGCPWPRRTTCCGRWCTTAMCGSWTTAGSCWGTRCSRCTVRGAGRRCWGGCVPRWRRCGTSSRLPRHLLRGG